MAEVKVRITGDNSGFNAAMTRAQVTATAFANRMRTLSSGIAARFAGLFGTAAIGMMVRNTIAWADQLNDTSKRLGVNAEQLQKWEYAAVQTGSSLEGLTATIEKLKKAQSDAARGSASARSNLAAFGIVAGDDVTTMMNKLAARVRSGSFDTGALMGVGGRGAGALIPALQEWQKLADEAERVGVVMRQENINALEKINDQFTFMSRFMMASLAPAIQFVVEKLIMLTGAVRGLGAMAGELAALIGAGAGAFGAGFGHQVGLLKRSGKAGLSAMRGAPFPGGAFLAGFAGSFAGGLGSGATPGPMNTFRNMLKGFGGRFFGAATDPLMQSMAAIQALRAGAPSAAGGLDFGSLIGRSNRPGRPEVDSLAKVGLFTASALNAGPVLDIQRRMERHLFKIEKNTRDTEGEQVA